MIEDIYAKRELCKVFTKDIPDSDTMMSIIQKTHRLVPSKQNLMPYKIHVLGPDCVNFKEELFKITSGTDSKVNTNFQVFAPYVLIFTCRLANPNPHVQRQIENGHQYKSCFPETYNSNSCVRKAYLEVGKWSTIFSGLCLEKSIDISYTKCFSFDKKDWTTLPFVKDNPIFVVSAGYHDKTQVMKIPGETKPDFDEVVCFEHE